jgi:hypothetical protein
MMLTDIVITTRNRLPYLKMTLAGIFERTHTPYALHVIDDASSEGNAEYLLSLWREGKIRSLLLRRDRCGLRAGHNVGPWISFSDPFVSTDDDVLCPDLDPDWLVRGLAEMEKRPDLGVLALDNPARRMLRQAGGREPYPTEPDDEVTYCPVVGGTFTFVRRAALEGWSPEHARLLPVVTPDLVRPVTERCFRARENGFRVGYLTDVYCYHFGAVSARDDKEKERILKPIDMKTLKPPEE